MTGLPRRLTGQDPEPAPGPPKPGKVPAGPREEPAPGTGPDWLRVLLRAGHPPGRDPP